MRSILLVRYNVGTQRVRINIISAPRRGKPVSVYEEDFEMSAANEFEYSGVDYLPQQFLQRLILFCGVPEEYKTKSGRFAKLQKGD